MSDIDDARAMTRASNQAESRALDEPETDEDEAERLADEDFAAEVEMDLDRDYGGDE